MKLNTVLAIAICALLPVFSYIVVKNYTDTNVKMPKKYFSDYVRKDTVDGKVKTDTVWHKVKNLKLVNQFGDTVQLDDLSGKVLLVNFFFTHCPTICPTITTNLKKVQKTLNKDSGVHIISISLDPKRDSTKRLFQYANQYGIKHDNWWLCNLVDDSLERVMSKEFKAGFERKDGGFDITHSSDIYLLDKKRIIRGKPVLAEITEENPVSKRFYDGLDTSDLFFMMNDVGLVKMERTVRNKPPFAILIASMTIMGAVFIFIMMRNRNKKKLI